MNYETKLNTLFTGSISPGFLSAINSIRGAINDLDRVSGSAAANVKKFGESLSTVKTHSSGLAKQLKGTAGAMQKVNKATKETTIHIGKLGSAFQTLGSYFIAGSVFTAFIQGMRGMTSTITEFDQALHNIKAITGATTDEIAKIGATLQSVASQSSFTITELGDAFKQIGQAGFTAKEGMDMIESASTLAIGTVSDLNRVVDLFTTTIRAFDLSAQDSERLSDIMTNAVNRSKLSIEKLRTAFNYVGKTASMAGVSIEDTATSLMTLANNGLRASTLGTGFRQVLAKMVAPNKKLTEALKAHGLALTDINPKIVGYREALQNVRLILTNTETGVIDMTKAFNYFKLRGAQVAAALANDVGPDGPYNRLNQQVMQLGTSAENAAIIMEGLGYKWDNLKSKLQNLATALGNAGIESSLKAIVDIIREAVEELTEFVKTDTGALVTQIGAATFAFSTFYGTLRLVNKLLAFVFGADILSGAATLVGSLLKVETYSAAATGALTALSSGTLTLTSVATGFANAVIVAGSSLLSLAPQIVAFIGTIAFTRNRVSKLMDMYKEYKKFRENEKQLVDEMKKKYNEYVEALKFEWKTKKEIEALTTAQQQAYMEQLQKYLHALNYKQQILEKEGASTKRVREEINRVIDAMKDLSDKGAVWDAHVEGVRQFSGATEETSDNLQKVVEVLNRVIAKFADYNTASNKAAENLEKQKKALSTVVRAYKTTYGKMLDVVKGFYKNQFDEIKAATEERLKYVENSIAEERGIVETVSDVYLKTYNKIKNTIHNYITTTSAQLKKYYDDRVALAEKTGKSIARIETDILDKRAEMYETAISEYHDMIDKMITEEERLRDKIKELTDWEREYRSSLHTDGNNSDTATDQSGASKMLEVQKSYKELMREAAKAARHMDTDKYKDLLEKAKTLLDSMPKSGYKELNVWGKVIKSRWAGEKEVNALRRKGYKELESFESRWSHSLERKMKRQARQMKNSTKEATSEVARLKEALEKVKKESQDKIKIEFEADTSKLDAALQQWSAAKQKAIEIPVVPEADAAIKLMQTLRKGIMEGAIDESSIPQIPVKGDDQALIKWVQDFAASQKDNSKITLPIAPDEESFNEALRNIILGVKSKTEGAQTEDSEFSVTIPVRPDDEQFKATLKEMSQRYSTTTSEDGLFVTFHLKKPDENTTDTEVREALSKYNTVVPDVNEVHTFITLDADMTEEELHKAIAQANEQMKGDESNKIEVGATVNHEDLQANLSDAVETVSENEEESIVVSATVNQEQLAESVTDATTAITESESAAVVIYPVFKDELLHELIQAAVGIYKSKTDANVVYLFPDINESAKRNVERQLKELSKERKVNVTAVPHTEDAKRELRELEAPIEPIWSPQVDISAVAKIKSIIAQMKKPIHTTWTVHKKIVTSRSSSSSSTKKRTGGEVQHLRAGGESLQGYNIREGFLAGYGGGDRIRALLEAGEYVIRKEAVRAIGVENLDKLNSMTSKAVAPIHKSVGGIIDDYTKLFSVYSRFFGAPTANMTDTAQGGNSLEKDAMRGLTSGLMGAGYDAMRFPSNKPVRVNTEESSYNAPPKKAEDILSKALSNSFTDISDALKTYKEAISLAYTTHSLHGVPEKAISGVFKWFSHHLDKSNAESIFKIIKKDISDLKQKNMYASSFAGVTESLAKYLAMKEILPQAYASMRFAEGGLIPQVQAAPPILANDNVISDLIGQSAGSSPTSNIVNAPPELGTLHLNIDGRKTSLTATVDSVKQLQNMLKTEQLRRVQ